jgi:hypothetical protein
LNNTGLVKVSGWWKMQNNFTGQYQDAMDIIDKKENLYNSRNFQITSTQTFGFKKTTAFSESSWNGGWSGRFTRRSFILSRTKNFRSNGVKTKWERQAAVDTENKVEK